MDKEKELTRGCVVFMKASSGLTGYGNGQCVSSVCKELGTVSLFGHNQHYKIYDIDRIVEYPPSQAELEAELAAYRWVSATEPPATVKGCTNSVDVWIVYHNDEMAFASRGYYDSELGWCLYTSYERRSAYQDHITHWMLIPALPPVEDE